MAGPRFATVIATLAVGPGCPAGDPDVTLELLAPLTADAQIDSASFAAVAEYCRVRRLRAGRDDGSFRLVRLDEGWALRLEAAEEGPLWPLEARLLRPGEYLTAHRPDGASLTFLVVNVEFPESA
jgi:hypothetical protein